MFMNEKLKTKKIAIKDIFSKALDRASIETFYNKIGVNFLQESAMAGDVDSIKELIIEGYDVNSKGEGGWTALLSSVAQGYFKITEILLNAGANPDIPNFFGITPLMYGSKYGNIEVCKILIDYGASLDLQDKYGSTALMQGIGSGSIEIVDMLIQAGADLSIKDKNKDTALDLAYKMGKGQIAKKLRKVDKKV
jgi:ankyrin repeat protein